MIFSNLLFLIFCFASSSIFTEPSNPVILIFGNFFINLIAISALPMPTSSIDENFPGLAILDMSSTKRLCGSEKSALA